MSDRINDALDIAFKYGQIDGAHHKTWVIDQMVRRLTEDQYSFWISSYEEDGEYTWDTGITP